MRTLCALVLAASLAGCAGAAGVAPPVANGARTLSVAASAKVWLTVAPASWTLVPGQSGGIQANGKTGHPMTATSADPACATVSPAGARPTAVPPGNHVALFVVTAGATGGCTTTITITGGPKEFATVPVTVTG